MSKPHLLSLAKRKFMQYKTLDEIAEEIPVSKTTLCEWSNRYNWKEQRDELEKNPENISKDLQEKLAHNVKLIKKDEDGTFQINGDNILKIAQTIKELGGVYDPFEIATIDMDRFSRFAKAKEGTWSSDKSSHVYEAIDEYLDELEKEC